MAAETVVVQGAESREFPATPRKNAAAGWQARADGAQKSVDRRQVFGSDPEAGRRKPAGRKPARTRRQPIAATIFTPRRADRQGDGK
jgi:hypothetical protein